MFGRRRNPAAPPDPRTLRTPSPDARVEAELQRVWSLRAELARKDALLAADHEQIASMRRMTAEHPTWAGHDNRLGQIDVLLTETGQLDRDIRRLHGEIADAIAKLTREELLYLDPIPDGKAGDR